MLTTNLSKEALAVITTDTGVVVGIVGCPKLGDIQSKVERAIKVHESAESVSVYCPDVLDDLDELTFKATVVDDEGEGTVSSYSIVVAPVYSF